MARPRQFEEEKVLDQALHLFWKHGYEGTGLRDLMSATRLTKSSLYKAFGSKEGLFGRVRERYDQVHLEFRRKALAETTPRRIVSRLLRGVVELHTGESTPPGCLATNSIVACSPESEVVRLQVVQEREAFRTLLKERLQIATSAGALPPGMTADTAASLVQTMIQGLAVQAKSGASRAELAEVVEAFLAGWPE